MVGEVTRNREFQNLFRLLVVGLGISVFLFNLSRNNLVFHMGFPIILSRIRFMMEESVKLHESVTIQAAR